MRNWKPGGPRARILARRTLMRTPYFRVVEEKVVYRGREFVYQFRPHIHVVHIVALTPSGDAVLVRQYRHPVRKALIELPAGSADPGEGVLAAAKRELNEETGYSARRWINLGGWYPSPASTNMKTYYFLALGARRTRRPHLDRYEFLRVERRPFAPMAENLRGIKDTTVNTLIGIELTARKLKRISPSRYANRDSRVAGSAGRCGGSKIPE